MRYEDLVSRIGESLAAQLRALLGGRFNDEDVVTFGADAVAGANVQAATAAVLHYAETMHDLTGTLSLPALPDMSHHTDTSRLRLSVSTIVESHREIEDAGGQMRRLALAETSDAAASAYGRVLRDDARVTGWRRAMNSNACQLCRWWSREGRVWPAGYPLRRHEGCTCTQEPVTAAVAPSPAPVLHSRRARR